MKTKINLLLKKIIILILKSWINITILFFLFRTRILNRLNLTKEEINKLIKNNFKNDDKSLLDQYKEHLTNFFKFADISLSTKEPKYNNKIYT